MKTVNKIALGLLFSLGLGSLCAQSILDPYQFAGSGPNGTARFNAMGGAFASVGGDGAGVSINPAGAGMYLNNQVDFSLGLNTVGANLNGQSELWGGLALPSANVIFHAPVANSDWKALNFGITSNRQLTYSRDIGYRQTTNAPNSIVDFFLNQANGIAVENLESENIFGYLAYQAYIIDSVGGMPGVYTSKAAGESDHRITSNRRGKSSDVDFSFSGNYKNKLYLGASMGYSNFSVSDEFLNVENFEDSSITKVLYSDESVRQGGAFMLKLGAIIRPIENLRIGAYYHIPRLYRVSTTYDIYAEAKFDDGGEEFERISFNEYLYRFQLPAKYGVGISYILKNFGLVSFDFEQMNLSGSKFAALTGIPGEGADRTFYKDENAIFRRDYDVMNTARFGLEAKLNNFYVRAGMQYQSNPLDPDYSDFSDKTTYTGGLGVRLKTMSLDFYGAYSQHSESYLPYDGAVLQKVSYSALNFGAGASFFF